MSDEYFKKRFAALNKMNKEELKEEIVEVSKLLGEKIISSYCENCYSFLDGIELIIRDKVSKVTSLDSLSRQQAIDIIRDIAKLLYVLRKENNNREN